MANGFKYPSAEYVDRLGKPVTILQANLHIASVRTEAMGNHLTVPGTQTRLYVRTGKRNYYFRTYKFNPRKSATWIRKESSVAHNQLRDRILRTISGNDAPQRIKIYTYPFKNGMAQRSGRHDIVRFSNELYFWEPEISRVCTLRARIRHDIFGSSTALPSSRCRPQVAIEVVDFHAPETKAIEAMLAQSIVSPLLVLFAFVKNEPWFFTMKSEKATLQVRCVVSIWYGELFHNDVPTGITTQQGFIALMKSLQAM